MSLDLYKPYTVNSLKYVYNRFSIRSYGEMIRYTLLSSETLKIFRTVTTKT